MPALTLLAAAVALASNTANGVADAPPKAPAPGISLTVYSSADPAGFDPQQFIQQQRNWGSDSIWGVPGYGVVKVVRKVSIPKGVGDLAFTDVAAYIDPTTVGFVDLEDAKTAVLEQNFQFDLVSPSKLLERYIGLEITATVPRGEGVEAVTGVLLSASQGQLVVRNAKGVHILQQSTAQVALAELPGGLLTKPTLLWKVASESGGEHLVRTTYRTGGMTWRADYNIVLDGSDRSADLSGWVSLMNLSGASFDDAELKLVAGKVNMVAPKPGRGGMVGAPAMRAEMMADGAAGFVEKEFFEYHLYTLPRRTDVAQNSTQQIALFPPVSGFKVRKELVLDWSVGFSAPPQPYVERDLVAGGVRKPAVLVSFENKKDNALGMPLPAGKVRVFKTDADDGALEFIGEDLIDHTPRNETVRVKLGESFDVVGERTRTDFTIDTAAKRMTESFRIEVRNQKSAAQRVKVVEHLFRWTNWSITKKSDDFTRTDASTTVWEVDVPSEGKRTIEYTVVYTW